LAQEALLLALERGPRDSGALRGWLAVLVRNAARKTWRSDARRARREHAAARPECAVPSPEEILEREDQRRALVERVLALEPPLREVMVLRYLEELPPRAIARRLGLPVETVRTRQKRGLDLLRGRMDRESRGDRAAWSLALVRGLQVPASTAEVCGVLAGASLGGVLVMGVVQKVALGAAAVGLVVLGALRVSGERARAEEPESAVTEPVELVASAPVALEGGSVESAAEARVALPAAVLPPAPAPLSVAAPTVGSLLLRVTWHDGTPAEDVAATIHASGAEDFYADAFEVRTGADGTVLVEGVPPGRVSPSLDRGMDAARVEVVAGELVVLAFVLPRGYDVSGRVVELDGSPVAGAEILLTTMGAAATSFHRVARSDAEGRFLVRSIDGLGWLTARAPLHAPTASYALFSGAGATLDVQLTFPGAGGTVEGDVRDASGNPVAGAQVIAGEESAFARATVPENVQAMTTPGAWVSAGEDGRFRAEGLPAGEQPVLVRARGFAPWRGAATIDAGSTTGRALRVSSYSRAFSMATPACVASTTSASSSSRVNSDAPCFSVR
jgi:RNA polymerase sigma-70 factor (ECF subfamily)